MEIEVKIEELRKKRFSCQLQCMVVSVLVCTQSLLVTFPTISTQYGMDIRFFYLFNESLITRQETILLMSF